MKKQWMGWMVLVLLLPAPLQAQEWAGSWRGVLDVPGPTGLTLVVHLEAGDPYTATLDSPAQGAMGIPVQEVEIEGDRITLRLPGIGAHYEGVRVGPDRIEGAWTQGGATFSLDLERTEEGSALPPRPQEPIPPFPYQVEEVVFPNEGAGIRLAGTLTHPTDGGPFAAAILITGSGPQDRDEALMGHRPFLVLADHLTRAGIAVLRVDDRGVAESEGDFASATSRDFATDVEAALDFLLDHPAIDPTRIGLIGHSEGGLIAPMVANARDEVAYIVLLAGPGLAGHELLGLQGRAILEAGGVPPELVEISARLQRELFDHALADGDDFDAILSEFLAEISTEERAQLGIPAGSEEAWKAAQASAIRTPWMREFLRHDPRDDLERVQVPVLALIGSLDLQVPPAENLAEIEAALARAGNEEVTLMELPGLNHLFQTATTGHPSEYASIEETLAPEALDAISSWLIERFGG
jgi:uncharacterized protein